MSKARLMGRIMLAVLTMVPLGAFAASGPEIPGPPKGGVGVLDFLMSLFQAIFAFLQNLFGGLPGIPG